MLILSIDPGIRGCGAAVWLDGRLVACAYVPNPAKKGGDMPEVRSMADAVYEWARGQINHTETFAEVVVEFPQVYFGAGKVKKGADTNDLLTLAAVDGAIATRFPLASVGSYKPAEWKRQMNESVTTARVESRLDSVESAVYERAKSKAKSLAHNMVDAVGVGLKHLGRFEPERAFAR